MAGHAGHSVGRVGHRSACSRGRTRKIGRPSSSVMAESDSEHRNRSHTSSSEGRLRETNLRSQCPRSPSPHHGRAPRTWNTRPSPQHLADRAGQLGGRYSVIALSQFRASVHLVTIWTCELSFTIAPGWSRPAAARRNGFTALAANRTSLGGSFSDQSFTLAGHKRTSCATLDRPTAGRTCEHSCR